jgi:Flp pilus assembly protein TadG
MIEKSGAAVSTGRDCGRRPRRRGAAVVEMAMCMPILFLLLFGCYEFARTNMIRHAISAAAYEGARTGITPGATVADVEASAKFILSTVGVRTFDITVTPNPIALRSQRVDVEILVAVRDNSALPMLYNHNTELAGACSLKREGGF